MAHKTYSERLKAEALYYASAAARRTVARLRKKGWGVDSWNGAGAAVNMVRTPGGGRVESCAVENDGTAGRG